MAGLHGSSGATTVPLRTRRMLTVVAASIAALTAVAALFLRPEGRFPLPEDVVAYGQIYDGHVEEVLVAPCDLEFPEDSPDCRYGSVRLRGGPDAGEAILLELPVGPGAIDVDAGDDVAVAHYTNPEAIDAGVQYQFVDLDRKPALIWLALLFGLVVVALGRLRGLAAIAGLAASIGILLVFVLPTILEGRPPLLVAVVGASAIAFVALYSAHGFRTMTTVALLGTVGALALTALLGTLFTHVAAISGLAAEETAFLLFSAREIDFAGIFLAGLVIGALGAIDDMTVTQASAVWELRAANPRMPRRDLLRAGLRIGRDHVASTVNTLALAYVGGSMTLMLLFVVSGRELTQVANGEIVAVEIVRTLVGSIGLVASVPITTWLAVRVVTAEPPGRQPVSEGRERGGTSTS